MIAFPFNYGMGLNTIGHVCYPNNEECIAIGDVKEQKRNNMISTDVFECPYCGHKKAEIKSRGGYRFSGLYRIGHKGATFYVLCGRCGARGPIENTIEDASMYWRYA